MSIVTINDENLKNIGNAIRTKIGSTSKYKPSEMANAISSIQGQEPKLQQKSVTPTTTAQTIKADSSYDGLSSVLVGAVTSAIDSDIKSANIKKGVSILGVTGTLEEGIAPTGTKEITTNGNHDVSNFANANVNVPTGITPSGTKEIIDNGDYDVTQYANAKVNVPKGITPSGTISITKNGSYDITNFASAVVEVANTGGTDSNMKIKPTYLRFAGSTIENFDDMFTLIDTSDLSNFETMFSACGNLTEINLTNIVSEHIKSTYQMFGTCIALKKANLRGLNCTNLTSAGNMFYNCLALEYVDIRNLDLSNLSSYNNMFENVPNNCLIIVKNEASRTKIKKKYSNLTNIKTLEEYQAGGGV